MKPLVKTLFPLLTLLMATSQGCSSCSSPTPAPPRPTMVISAPADQTTLTREDDKDGDPRNGIQLDIVVVGTDLERQQRIVLNVATNDDPPVSSSYSAIVDDSMRTVFESVDLPVGQITISASMTFSTDASIQADPVTITVPSLVLPSISISAPADGSLLGAEDDLDYSPENPNHLINGFHINVTVTAQDVDDDLPVTLFVADQQVAQLPFAGGQVTFEGVQLPESPTPPGIALRATVNAQTGDLVESEIHVQVSTGSCVVTVEPPPNADDSCEFVTGDDTIPGTTDSVDVNFTLRTNCSTVDLQVNDWSMGVREIEDGVALYEDVPLDQWDDTSAQNRIQVIYTDPVLGQGFTPPLFYLADTIAPSLSISDFAAPPEENLLRQQNDRDQEQEGLQINLTGSICGAGNDNTLGVTISPAEGGEPLGDAQIATILPEVNEQGCNIWQVNNFTLIDPGTFDVTAAMTDDCGNTGSYTVRVRADFIQPTLAFLAPAADAILLPEADEDAEAEGFQITTSVEICYLDVGSEFTVTQSSNEAGPYAAAHPSPIAMPDTAGEDCASIQVPITIPRPAENPASWNSYLVAEYEGLNPASSRPPLALRVAMEGPSIAIGSPTEGQRVGPGNLQVCALSVNVEDGQQATLTVNDQAHAPTVAVQGNSVCFDDVVIQPGANTLWASVANTLGQAASSVVVNVIQDVTPPQVAITSPLADQTYDSAADSTGTLVDGFQLDVVVTITEEDPGTTVCLQLGGGQADCEPDATDADTVTFSDFGLLPGGNTLRATATDSVGQSGSSSIDINVDIPLPRVEIADPADGSCLQSGTDVQVRLTTDALDGSSATLNLNGSDLPTPAAVSGGEASFLLNLPDNLSSTLVGSVTTPDDLTGQSLATSVTVKSTLPTLSFLGSITDGLLSAADADAAPALAGYQSDIQVRGQNLTPGQEATLSLDCGAEVWTSAPTAVAGDTFTFAAVELPAEGSCAASVSSSDCAGNLGQATLNFSVDRVGPSLAIDSPRDSDVLAYIQDRNPAVEGVQVDVICRPTGVESGQDLWLLVAGQELDRHTLATDNERTIFSLVSLPDGDAVVIRCAGIDAAGNSGFSEITVTVRSGEPELVWTSPNPNQENNWSTINDTDLAPGFQGDFRVATANVPNNTIVRLCSNNHGNQGDACGQQGFRELARSTAQNNLIQLTGVSMAQGQHSVYVEALMDELENWPASPNQDISVDSLRPTIVGIDATSNGNADAYLNAAEDVGGSPGLQASFSILTGAGDDAVEDGQQLRLLSDNPNPGTVLGAGPVQGNAVQLTVNLAEGFHADIRAEVTDIAGNAALAGGANALSLTVDTVVPGLSITTPTDASTLLATDDTDGNPNNGLQYNARLVVSAARTLTVRVNDVQQGNVLQNPDGTVNHPVAFPVIQNTLSAEAVDAAGNQNSAQVSITAAPRAPTVDITSPGEGQNYAEGADTDALRGGFQVRVDVQSQDLAPGRPVSISSSAAGVVSDPATVGGDGSASVTCTLPPGEQTLTAQVSDEYGNQATSTPVSVTVEVSGCGLAITDPAGNPVYVNIAADADAGTDGAQFRVRSTVLNPACNGETAELLVNAVPYPETVVVANNEAIWPSVTLGEANYEIQIRIQPAGDEDSFSAAKDLFVDLTAPDVSFTAPAGAAADLNASSDLDPGSAGLQYTFGFDITGAAQGSLSLSSDVQGALASRSPLSAASGQTLDLVTVNDGSHNLTATVTDQAGNSGNATISANIDTAPPAALGGFAANLSNRRRPLIDLTWTAPGDDANAGGPVASYELRYSAAPIDDGNFAQACASGVVIVPANAGEDQSAQLSGPGPDGDCSLRVGGVDALRWDPAGNNLRPSPGEYYVALRATDDAGNSSPVASDGPITARMRSHVVEAPEGTTKWGRYVRGAGDVNNDGFDDVVVGVVDNERAYIVYGAADPSIPGAVQVSPLNKPAASTIYFGYGVAGVGDVNGDGADDVIVKDFYSVFIYFGSLDGSPISPDPGASFGVTINGFANYLGGLSKAGNFDGDAGGMADFVIGVPTDSNLTGGAYIVSGRANWPVGHIILGDDDAANGLIRFAGDSVGAPGGYLGLEVGYAGDGDGDGRGDVLLGAYLANGSSGLAYLVRGRAAPAGPISPQSANVLTLSPPPESGAVTFGTQFSGGYDLIGSANEDFTVAQSSGRTVFLYDGETGERVETISRTVGEFGIDHSLVDIDDNGRADLFVTTRPAAGYLYGGEVDSFMRGDDGFLAPGPVFTGGAEFGQTSNSAQHFTGANDYADLVIGSPTAQQVIILY